MKTKLTARPPPATRNIPELGILENKARLALETAPAGRLKTPLLTRFDSRWAVMERVP